MENITQTGNHLPEIEPSGIAMVIKKDTERQVMVTIQKRMR